MINLHNGDKNLNRNFIGIEINAKYYETAKNETCLTKKKLYLN